MSDLARALRVCRAFTGQSQDELAAAARISGSYLSLLESGKRQATLQTAHKLCRALGISLRDFLSIAEAPTPHDLLKGHK